MAWHHTARIVGLTGITLAVALTPALVAAQRSGVGGMGGGMGRGRAPGSLAREPGIAVPQQVNMVNLLIQHRPELALSDTQFTRVIALKRTLDSTNAPLLRKLDSVQRIFRGGPIFSDPSPARRDSLAEARFVVRETTAAVHENNSSARDRAYTLLNAQQLLKAEELESKAEKAIEDEARKASGEKRP